MSAAQVRYNGAWVDSDLTGAVRVAGAWVEFGPPVSAGVSLFTNQVPDNLDAADTPDNYSLGTYMSSSVPGTITHVRWPFPITAQPGGVAPKANLFRTATSTKAGGTDVAFAMPGVQSSPGVPAWNQVALNTPVHVVADEEFCPTIWTPLRYVATPSFFSSPLTNGPLTAPTNAGRFISGASGNVDFPASAFAAGGYFVDVLFIPD